jgi:hypothetical protein
MVEQIQRWAVLLAIAAMSWVAWSGLRQDATKQFQHEVLPEIPLARMPLRTSSEPRAELGDPCKLEARVAAAEKPAPKPANTAVETASTAVRALTLDSILAFPGGAQAYICGQTIMVGEPIHGVDMEHPPVLAWIDGVRVGVRYKNREYVLDLDHDRQVSLDPHSTSAAVQAAARKAASDHEAGGDKDGVRAGARDESGAAPKEKQP